MQNTTILEAGARATQRTLCFAGALALFIGAITNPASAQTYRAIDGFGNNPNNPELGSAGTPLLRQLLPSDYADGVSALAGSPTRPNPRSISNALNTQVGSVPNSAGVTSFVFQWGQFLDHDIDLTGADQAAANIAVLDPNDAFFPASVIFFNRSNFDPATSVPGIPREQINQITAFIDASNVYGSDPVRANFLRTFTRGQLKTSPQGLLPYNTEGLPNAGGPSPELFIAGDVRANEQVGLTAMHILFMREHNRLASQFHSEASLLSMTAPICFNGIAIRSIGRF